MSPEEFRRYGREVVDWIAGYLDHPEQYPVLPHVRPGELVDSLPKSAPEKGEPFDTILADFERQIVPGITHWNHPGFMAYFANTSPGPAILGELLAAALNTNAMLWKTSPAASELEQVTLDWLRQWMGIPEKRFGIIFDTASTSSLHGIAAAREKADPEIRRCGSRGGLTLYTSEQAHSSIEKGAIALGIGQQNVRKIPVDADFRMRADLLAKAIEKDLAAGLHPFCISATIGTTSTASVDPLDAIADVSEKHGLWLHVDGAYGGSAAIVPELRPLFHGLERADSIVVNAHKWLFTPMDLSVFYTRHPEILRRAFSLVPEYLRTAEDGRVVNYMDYGVPLGRRFRALKLWFVMRYYGHKGLVTVMRSQIALAKEFTSQIEAHPCFELAAPTVFSVVCFRYKGSDAKNRALLDRVNASGEVFLSHTELHGKFTLHLSIGNMWTTRAHVQRAWQILQKEAESL